MKNVHVALMVSQGTPMMLMGDEYGHTRHGNNNSYGHDNHLNWFLWKQVGGRKGEREGGMEGGRVGGRYGGIRIKGSNLI